jgi:hypothetical protein
MAKLIGQRFEAGDRVWKEMHQRTEKSRHWFVKNC